MNGDLSVCINSRVHKQIYRVDDRTMLSENAVDIVKAVRVSAAVLVEKVIHLRAARWKKKIMHSDIIRKNSEHRVIQVRVQFIANIQFQGFVAIERNSGREKFLAA